MTALATQILTLSTKLADLAAFERNINTEGMSPVICNLDESDNVLTLVFHNDDEREALKRFPDSGWQRDGNGFCFDWLRTVGNVRVKLCGMEKIAPGLLDNSPVPIELVKAKGAK